MRGNLRFRAGAWRLQVYAGTDPATGKDRRVTRTVRAPNNRAGRRTAEEALAALVLEVSSTATHLSDDLTVDELLARWITARQADWSPKTTLETRRQVRLKITPRIGSRPLRSIRAADLDALYAELRSRGGAGGGPLAASSVRRVHVILHAAFEQAAKWGLIAVNPASRATPPKVERPEIRVPSPDELARALAAVDDSDAALAAYLRLAATTGARRSQLCALHWRDVDLAGGTVTFSRAIVDSEAGVVEKGTKSGRSWRVALTEHSVGMLERWRRIRLEQTMALGVPLSPDTYVFARNPEGTLPWRPDTVTQRWIRLRRRAGLGEVPLHGLRHFVATQLLAAGMDPRTVAGRLGHANPNVTMAVYAHFVPERDREAAAEMDRVLGF